MECLSRTEVIRGRPYQHSSGSSLNVLYISFLPTHLRRTLKRLATIEEHEQLRRSFELHLLLLPRGKIPRQRPAQRSSSDIFSFHLRLLSPAGTTFFYLTLVSPLFHIPLYQVSFRL